MFQEAFTDKNEYSKQDIISLLKINDADVLAELYGFAAEIKEKYIGNKIQRAGVVKISNICSKNCLYCEARRSNEKILRDRLELDKIVDIAIRAQIEDYDILVLESAEDSYFDVEKIMKIIKKIKENSKLFISLSIGERTQVEYKRFKEAGALGYGLNHKTSDPILYRQLHPDSKYADRIKSIRVLKQLGFNLESGITIGYPGQTLESIANDILLFKALNIDTIDINPYIPHIDTPLAKKFLEIGGYFAPAIGYFDIEEMIYKLIAITRIVNKSASLKAARNLNLINKEDGKMLAVKYGANILIEDILPY